MSIVWAIEKLHIYVYGNQFKLITDCKPLQFIFNNPKSKPPARIERWNLRLQGYDFKAVHTEGSRNPSDYLSRHSSLKERENTIAEEYVHFLSSNAVPKAMTLKVIQQATTQDKTLQCVAYLIRNSSWNKLYDLPREYKEANQSELNLFKRVKDELTIVLKGSRIVIPEQLREKAVSIAHEGHQGLVKTKQLLREKVWFPGIDKYVKRVVDTCIACQANGPVNRPDPLQMSQLPPAPWHTLHMDFCGPFPSGEYLVVVINAYSRFPQVDIVRSISASAIIPKLDQMFATHGIPTIVCSDNGPPFTSHEIQQYMEENGVQHRRITPLWPQANSEAERFMQPLTKAIRSAHAEGKQWTKHLHRFLLNYRTTPHATTGFSPAEVLFNRKIQNKLPQMVSTPPDKGAQVQDNDDRAKEKMKKYADVKRRARPSQLKVGDTVLVRQRKQNKFCTRSDPVPFKVVRKRGTMITASRNGKYITRNASHFKVIDPSLDNDQQATDDEEDELNTAPLNVEAPIHQPPPINPPALRRSTRNRSTPQRFGQFVCHANT